MPYLGSDKLNTNSAGYLRDPIKFGKSYLENFSETLSKANVARIENNLSPIVDKQWLKFNLKHKNFLGETLEHHHINNTDIAAYTPKTLHRIGSNKEAMHTDTMNILKETTEVIKQKIIGV